MATSRRLSSPPPNAPPATWFVVNGGAGPGQPASSVPAHVYGGHHQARHVRSASALTPEEHRRQTAGSPLVREIREQRSLVSLRPESHLEAQRRQLQVAQRQRAVSYAGPEDAHNGANGRQQLPSNQQPEEPEKSKFFVRSDGLPSSWALAKGPILTNAVVCNPSGKLYEFVFPPYYKPVILRPSFWQKCFKAPEYHVVLLDEERYMPEPFVIMREAYQFAPTGRPWRSTEKDEHAIHIASCHREKVISIVQNELRRRSKYCAEEFRRALKLKKEHYETNRDVARRDLVQRDHKLMQIAADCAGDKGARGAKWLYERLVKYLEFVGPKEGDEVVVRAAKFLVDDIKSTAKQTDISRLRGENDAGATEEGA